MGRCRGLHRRLAMTCLSAGQLTVSRALTLTAVIPTKVGTHCSETSASQVPPTLLQEHGGMDWDELIPPSRGSRLSTG